MQYPFRLLSLARSLRFLRLHVQEAPDHNNDGQMVEYILKTAGSEKGQPWCAAAAYTAVKEAVDKYGVDNPLAGVVNKALVQSYVDYARKQNLVVDHAEAVEGDFICFDFTGSGHFDHIGVVLHPIAQGVFLTVEGNTNENGSREGYEMARKSRPVIHPERVLTINWDKMSPIDTDLDEETTNDLKAYGLID